MMIVIHAIDTAGDIAFALARLEATRFPVSTDGVVASKLSSSIHDNLIEYIPMSLYAGHVGASPICC